MDDIIMYIVVAAVIAVVAILVVVLAMRSKKAKQAPAEPAKPAPATPAAPESYVPSAPQTPAVGAQAPVVTAPRPPEPEEDEDEEPAPVPVTTLPRPPAPVEKPAPAPVTTLPRPPAPAAAIPEPAPAPAPAVKDITPPAPPKDISPAAPAPRDISAPAPAAGGVERYAKKISLIGDGGVGKTSLINRFVQGMFDDKYIHTIGTNVKKKVIMLPDEKAEVNLMIWDLQGQRNDPYIFSHMYKSEGAIVVCDVTRDNTFNAMPEWIAILERELKLKVPLILVGNKADLVDEMVVSKDQVEYMATKYNANAIMTSAKTGDNVEAAFVALAKKIIGKK